MSKKSFFKKSAHLSSVINPFDLVDTPEDNDNTAIEQHDELAGNIIVSLRKATKKDVTSKFKALEELQAVVVDPHYLSQIQSAVFAKHLLKLFAKLSVDAERRVREAVFALLWRICEEPLRRRSLNHIIGELAFYWLGALYDPVSAVAVGAKRCLESAFASQEKIKLFVNSVKTMARHMITDTINFRAEEAREQAVNDVDYKDVADFIYGLHITRAVSAEAFLGRHDPDQTMTDLIMSLVDRHNDMINSTLYMYAMAVTIPDHHSNKLVSVGLKDTCNADLVLDFINSKQYSHLQLPVDTLCDFCKTSISTMTRTIIPKIATLIKRLPVYSQLPVITASSRPNTLDPAKLRAIIEDLFVLINTDHERTTLFEMVVVERALPWTNLDVITALESFVTVFGADFVDRQLDKMTSKSVPLLVFQARRTPDSVDSVCEQLCQLTIGSKLSPKDLMVVLNDAQLASRPTITRAVFDSFVDALNRSPAHFAPFLHLFDITTLLQVATNTDVILRHLIKHGGSDAPWAIALASCDNETLVEQMVSRVLQVALYTDPIMDAIINTTNIERVPSNINESWLESPRFAEWLIEHDHVDLVPVGVARLLPVPVQLVYIHRYTGELVDYLDRTLFVNFCKQICRSSVSFKRTLFAGLHETTPNTTGTVCEQVVLALVDKKAISKELSCHVIAYLMWLEDCQEECDHGDRVSALLTIVDADLLLELSRSDGGYYSYILQLLNIPIKEDSGHQDHLVVYHRQRQRQCEIVTIDDISNDIILSVLIPLASRLSNDLIHSVLQLQDNPLMMAHFMAALPAAILNTDAVKSKVDLFIQTHPLTLTATIMAHHPDFAVNDPPRRDAICKSFFTTDQSDSDHSLLMRQVAPFVLDRLANDYQSMIIQVCGGDGRWHRRRCARLCFNLLHDNILQRLQFVLSDAADREAALLSVLGTDKLLLQPTTMDMFELLIGLVEACGEEMPLVNATIQSMVDLDCIVPQLIDTLHWNSDTPTDLTRLEFTTIDWDKHQPITLLSANVMFRGWRTFPTAMRRAFTAVSIPRLSRMMAAYISPMIMQRELEKCRRHARTATGNLIVRVLASSTQCQIAAEYKVEEEESVSVCLLLPSDFPLSRLHVDCKTGRRGLPESKWKAALLSATAILSTSSHPLAALLAWSANMDRMLGGVEPCAICYCVMHAADRTLPTPACSTCGNKFHAQCLYKWFRTGGQATCPMCRSLF